MREGSFRGIVREELVIWMDKNRGRFDLMMQRILEQIAPVIADQLERGILVRLGKLEPDEREQMQWVMEHARNFVSSYGLGKPNAVDQADQVLRELDAGIARLQGPARSPKGEE
jgi:hypothetical protein